MWLPLTWSQALAFTAIALLALCLCLGAVIEYAETRRPHDRDGGSRDSRGADGHVESLASITALAASLRNQGKYRDAEPLYREALERTRRAYGRDDSRTLAVHRGLGRVLLEQDQLAEAEALLLASLEGTRRTLGVVHVDTLASVFAYYELQMEKLLARIIRAQRLEPAAALPPGAPPHMVAANAL